MRWNKSKKQKRSTPKLKKSKTRYSFICYKSLPVFLKDNKLRFDDEKITGNTDNPCRTATALWKSYDCKNKEVSFDINKTSKAYDFKYELQFSDIEGKKIYKYQDNIITREQFVILLGCET